MRAVAVLLVALSLIGAAGVGAAYREWKFLRQIDGDTFQTLQGLEVRIIGIDAPERGQCGYWLATYQLGLRMEGPVWVATERGLDRDPRGRYLRYVRDDGIDVGLSMIRDGWADINTEPGWQDVSRAGRYFEARAVARRRGAGLWDICGHP